MNVLWGQSSVVQPNPRLAQLSQLLFWRNRATTEAKLYLRPHCKSYLKCAYGEILPLLYGDVMAQLTLTGEII